MPLMQTLEIEEIVKLRQLERERTAYKRAVFGMTMHVRKLSAGVLRRMHQMDAAQTLPAHDPHAAHPQPGDSADAEPSTTIPWPAPPIVDSAFTPDSAAAAEVTDAEEPVPQAAE